MENHSMSRPLWIQLFAMYDLRTALQGYGQMQYASNQANTDQRNKQVRQMDSIYACAGHTNIFFNSSTAEAELFLDTVRTYNNV